MNNSRKADNHLIDNRQIRVFISSTFQDMQDERDYLMKYTFPVLRKTASERDVTLTELDLRWGITEEEAKSGKVVEICLREISNCIPFFIGIIGNRYGWVPQKKDIGENVTDYFDNVNNYLERHLSVTEMEMQFGVLDREEDMHAYFYILEENEKSKQHEIDNPEMLERLKKEVKASRYPSITYLSPEDLGLQVQQAFTSLLDQLFPEGNLSELEKERIGQRSFMNQLCQNYIRDDHDFQVLDEWLKDWSQHQMVITGESGLGKSALIANWLKEKLQDENRDYNIIYHFTGNGGSESNHNHIINILNKEIEEIYRISCDIPKTTDKIWKLFQLIEAEDNKPLLIVIDAINQIEDIDNAKLLNWLPAPTNKIKILISTLKTDKTMRVFEHRNCPIFEIQPLSIKRRQQLAENYLGWFSKKLTPEQIRAIVNGKQCENTLVLKTLLDELISFGCYEKLDERIKYYLAPNNNEDFYQQLLQNYEEEFSQYDGDFVKHLLSLIAVSKDGLTDNELLEITHYKPLHWSQFYCSFLSHLISKSGRISLSHSYIRDAIQNRYFSNDQYWEESCRMEVLSYAVELRKSDRYTIPIILEIPFQCFKIGDDIGLDCLYHYIATPEMSAALYARDPVLCVKYWESLLQHGYSLNIFLQKVFEPTDAQKIQRLGYNLIHLVRAFGKADVALSIAEWKLHYFEIDSNVSKMVLAAAYIDVANEYYESTDNKIFLKAIEYYCKVIKLLKDDFTPDLGAAYNGLALCFNDIKDSKLAIQFAKKSIEVNEQYYGKQHLDLAINYNTLGHAYASAGKTVDAIESYKKSIEIIATIKGVDSIDLIIVYNNLARLYLEENQQEEAYTNVSKAISIIESVYGTDYYDLPSYYELLSEIKNKTETI